jgi:methylisocitrate lyase
VFPAKTSPYERRLRFRTGLASGKLLRLPGAMNPVTAAMIERLGFDGVYVSGSVVAAELGFPDVGATTLSEVVGKATQIARVTDLPTIVDGDTGYGGPINVARATQVFEDAGLAGMHIEDQIDPKRCGHLDGKALVDPLEMCRKIRAACHARRDIAFVICARTDARTVEGFDAMLERAQLYVEAGADLIFLEALGDETEIAAARRALDVPLLVNMTEFGKSPLLTADRLEALGVNVAIYPVTLFRLAMRAAESGLRVLLNEGTQESLLPQMLTRAELYDLLSYERYVELDESGYTFTLPAEDLVS